VRHSHELIRVQIGGLNIVVILDIDIEGVGEGIVSEVRRRVVARRSGITRCLNTGDQIQEEDVQGRAGLVARFN
jgi:hypothetical protein